MFSFKRTFLLVFIPIWSFGQKIESSSKFSITNLTEINEENPPKIVSVDFENNGGRIKVYSSIDLFGNVIEKSGNKGSRLQFMFGEELFGNKKQGFLFSSVTLNERNEKIDSKISVISKYLLDSRKQYEFDYSLKKNSEEILKLRNIDGDYNSFVKENPDYHDYLNQNEEYSLISKSDSKLNIKNRSLYPAKKTNYFETNDKEETVMSFQTPLNHENWVNKFTNYDDYFNFNTNIKLPDGNYLQMVIFDSGQSLTTKYKNFDFFCFDSKGQYISSKRLPSKISASPLKVSKVFNKSGEYIGVYYLFKNETFKMDKDEAEFGEDMFQIMFFDKNGNFVLKKQFNYPNKIYPLICYNENGKYELYNKNTLSWKKDAKYDILSFDIHGSFKIDSYDPFENLPNFEGKELTIYNPIFIGDKIFDISLDFETKVLKDVAGNQNLYYYYTGASLKEFTKDMKFVAAKKILSQKPSMKRIQFTVIPEEGLVVFTHFGGNSLYSLKQNSNTFHIMPEKAYTPFLVNKNFHYSVSDKSLKFVYQGIKAGEGQVVSVKL